MNLTIRGLHTEEKGQTLVEFALILLLLLILLFGITEVARAWFFSNALTNGVRSGARFASTLANFSTATAFENTVKNYTFTQVETAITVEGMTPDIVAVTAADSGNNPISPITGLTPGDTVTVEVTYDFQVLTGSIVPYFSGTKTLVRKATMRYEGR